MVFSSDIHHRRSIRLKKYNYSQGGMYFITVCVQNRACLLGEVLDSRLVLYAAGDIVLRSWVALPERFPGVVLDEFIVMPNHMHGVIQIVGAPLAAPLKNDIDKEQGAASSAPTVGQIIRAFKSISAIAINALLDRQGQPFWQRNYWERIIRNESELLSIREYIQNNPSEWKQDKLYAEDVDLSNLYPL